MADPALELLLVHELNGRSPRRRCPVSYRDRTRLTRVSRCGHVTIALLSFGAAFELLGIALVGASDVMPELRRGAVWVDRQYRRFKQWARRILRIRQDVTVQVEAGGAVATGGEVTMMTGTSATDVEGRVEYLLRESERTQRRLNDLERTSQRRRAEIKAELARLNVELVAYVDGAIRTALAEYATARRVGIICLGVATFLFVLAAVAS